MDGGGAALRVEYQRLARDLVERMCSLPEPAMRTAALAQKLQTMGALQAVWTLEALIRGVMGKKKRFGEVYDSLLNPLALERVLSAEHLDRMLRAGTDEGCVAALQWLLSGSAGQVPPLTEPGRLIDKELQHLTLGDRRARARRVKGELINRYAMDPDPGVIGNLLSNPRVTEAVVLKICARRPTVSAPLEAVLDKPRWIRRYPVKLALVKNPYLAQRFAVNLLPTLTRADLCSVRDDESLVPTLRLAAQRLLDIPI